MRLVDFLVIANRVVDTLLAEEDVLAKISHMLDLIVVHIQLKKNTIEDRANLLNYGHPRTAH